MGVASAGFDGSSRAEPAQNLKTSFHSSSCCGARSGHGLAYTQKPIIYGGLAARLTGTFFFRHHERPRLCLQRRLRASPVVASNGGRLVPARLRRARTIFVFNGERCPVHGRPRLIDGHVPIVQCRVRAWTRSLRECPDARGPPTFIMIAR